MSLEEKNSPKLTDYPKAIAEFEQRYENNPDYQETGFTIATFYNLPFDLQSGVYLRFLRRKGINICVIPHANCLPEWPDTRHTAKVLNMSTEFISAQSFKTQDDYDTALIEAIEAGFAKLEAAECG